MSHPYESWGRYPKAPTQEIRHLGWASQALPTDDDSDKTLLPRGLGRSYGDVCTNEGGALLDCRGLSRFLDFDPTTGVLRCEGGVTLEEILGLCVSRGWFIPVTPGTKYVTVGGAIANDVHGKNHHVRGCFGGHVRRFELLRSDGTRQLCSPETNEGLFAATVGGLGLTGVITWAELQLLEVNNGWIDEETIKIGNLSEFFDVTAESSEGYEYTVAWVDSLAKGADCGKGIFFRGNHAPAGAGKPKGRSRQLASIPLDMPKELLNKWTMKAFNVAFYGKQLKKRQQHIVHYEPFFYPLDILGDWNRIYGDRGFVQHQCVVPYDGDDAPTRAVLERVANSGTGSFLTVVKMFGDVPSPGMLSFPRPGITLCFDIPFDGNKTLALCDDLDAIVREAGGRLYPAKDARMSPEMFRLGYGDALERFSTYLDPAMSSGFWRRVDGPPARVARSSRAA